MSSYDFASDGSDFASETEQATLSDRIDRVVADAFRPDGLDQEIRPRTEAQEMRARVLEINRETGDDRERQAEADLRMRFPEAEGYELLKECTLRDGEGSIARDPETGSYRRVDFVVAKDGEVVRMFEVTSETAPKEAQLAKEVRILESGGNHVRHPDGNLLPINNEVVSEVLRVVAREATRLLITTVLPAVLGAPPLF